MNKEQEGGADNIGPCPCAICVGERERAASGEGFTFTAFHQGVMRTFKLTDERADLAHIAFGLFEEAGEVAGKFKRAYREDGGDITEARREQLLLEIGDVLWYADTLSHLLNSSLAEVAMMNNKKLADRKERGVLNGEGDAR